jgi:hypothetical protein
MKYFVLIISAAILLFIDGTLTYDIFDPKTWSFADVFILVVSLALFCAIAWGNTKNNKSNHIPR